MRWPCLVGILGVWGCTGTTPPPAEPTPLRVEDSLVTAGPLQLAFHVVPGGEPALLLEAADGDSSAWGTLPDQLATATGRRVISYDRAGFGKSPFPAVAFTVEDEVAAIQAGVHRVGATKVVPVAAAYGALIDLAYAHAHPEDLAGLVLIDPLTTDFIAAVGLPALMPTMPVPAAPATNQERAAVRVVTSLPALVEKLHGVRWPAKLPMVVVTADAPRYTDAQLQAAWRASHETLAMRPGASQKMGSSEPATVIAAVQAVLAR